MSDTWYLGLLSPTSLPSAVSAPLVLPLVSAPTSTLRVWGLEETRAGGRPPRSVVPHWHLSETQVWAGCHAELSQEVLQSGGGAAGWWTPLQADPRAVAWLQLDSAPSQAAPASEPRPRDHQPHASRVKNFPCSHSGSWDISAAGRPEENQCVCLPTQTWAGVPGPGTPALAWLPLERR